MNYVLLLSLKLKVIEFQQQSLKTILFSVQHIFNIFIIELEPTLETFHSIKLYPVEIYENI